MAKRTVRFQLLYFLSIAILSLLGIWLIVASLSFINQPPNSRNSSNLIAQILPQTTPSPHPTPAPTASPIPNTHIIPLRTHAFQTFNNCGPASLSMALSYYDIYISQQEIGNKLRPYQIANGDNDDKSVTFPELVREAENYGLVAFYRPNGTIEILKQLIAQDLPVLTRTWTKVYEDIGHYRLVRGYDDTRKIVMQDDSLQNKNLEFSNEEFLQLWQGFNYEYIVLAPPDKQAAVESILGAENDPQVAYQKALERAQTEAAQAPDNPYPIFNQVTSLYYLGRYQEAVNLFEQVQSKLPSRMLWYNTEPIAAYLALGNYQKVFALTETILNNQNRAFSELYVMRAQSYLALNQPQQAREELHNAILYNQNWQVPQEMLTQLDTTSQ
ncbi:hypothetical protein C4579_03265 [Candidatus Microgenomates bacterium]|nr:MAG: hypothetical protein C4579_03265 [Candidatus Microgenomates bacterium]